MKKIMLFCAVIGSLAVLAMGCGGGGGEGEGTATFTGTAVSEGFEYTTSSPWGPNNGWVETQVGGSWNIITGGVTGNALQFHTNHVSLIANSYSGTNYTISSRVLPVNLVGGWTSGIVGRLQDEDHWYALCINRSGTDIYLEIRRFDGAVLALLGSILASAALLDPATWYTLTMKFSGSTIIGSLVGGGVNASLTVTDATLPSGRPGVLGWSGDATYDVRFDDYTVTVP